MPDELRVGLEQARNGEISNDPPNLNDILNVIKIEDENK